MTKPCSSKLLVFLSTPSARRATHRNQQTIAIGRFLSTPSARRATLNSLNTGTGGADFYPRPPRGGRLFFSVVVGDFCQISIHALREEGDS